MKQPMGKHVAALRVGAELDFIDGEKLDFAVERHRFHSADEIAGPKRHNFFFAGDQRDLGQAAGLDHAIVDLAREQPQGQPNHARGVSQHALHRQMGLPGVGRPKNGDEPRAMRRVGHGVNVEDEGARRKSLRPWARSKACQAARRCYVLTQGGRQG